MFLVYCGLLREKVGGRDNPLQQTFLLGVVLLVSPCRRRRRWQNAAMKSVSWRKLLNGASGGRLNDIAPGIVVTPLALDEFNGPRGDFYKNMFANCPAGRPRNADEIANVAELLMIDKDAFITGSTFLIDGGATVNYFYGPLKPQG